MDDKPQDTMQGILELETMFRSMAEACESVDLTNDPIFGSMGSAGDTDHGDEFTEQLAGIGALGALAEVMSGAGIGAGAGTGEA